MEVKQISQAKLLIIKDIQYTLNISFDQAVILFVAGNIQISEGLLDLGTIKMSLTKNHKLDQDVADAALMFNRNIEDGYINEKSKYKSKGIKEYICEDELIQYLHNNNTGFLELLKEKNNICNLAYYWFQQSIEGRKNNMFNTIIEVTNTKPNDPIIKFISSKNNCFHTRAAVIILIGSYLDSNKSLSVNKLLDLAVPTFIKRSELHQKWADPGNNIYKLELLDIDTIINDKVTRVRLSKEFIEKFNIPLPYKVQSSISSDFFEIIQPNEINETKLIYPENVQYKISNYFKQISHERYPDYIIQMQKHGLPENFVIMLYGDAGVGKTELVKQIALKYNRPILSVNLSELRTMWYGESERLVHQLFVDIKLASEELETEPIVLFNEADGFFHSRSGGNKYKNEASINIITILLNELENFNGILIATSNFTDSIDKAFERRFTLKIHIPNPDAYAVREIIKHKLNINDEVFINRLVLKYNISPAELDNVKQKSILLNIHPDQQSEMEELIREEHLGWNMNNNRKLIGFN